jgi:hypothetical protein
VKASFWGFCFLDIMNRIVKVILEDGEVLEIENFKTKAQVVEEFGEKEAWWRYRRQFKDFEEDLLEYHIDDDVSKDWAINKFDLIDEDDVEEKEVDDFTTKELMDELADRGFYIANINNPIAQDILKDMIKLFNKYSLVELSDKVSQL